MERYIGMAFTAAVIFFVLAACKYPVRKMFAKTKLYVFFYKAHRPFAVVAWACITVYSVLEAVSGRLGTVLILMYLSFNIPILLGLYKTYGHRKISNDIFRFHKIFAAVTFLLMVIHRAFAV